MVLEDFEYNFLVGNIVLFVNLWKKLDYFKDVLDVVLVKLIIVGLVEFNVVVFGNFGVDFD